MPFFYRNRGIYYHCRPVRVPFRGASKPSFSRIGYTGKGDGDYSNAVILTARAEGYVPVQWSVDSLDWKNKGAQAMISRATQRVQSGDIVLFHNDSKYILDALPAILKSYQQQGLTVVPVGQLLLTGKTTLDVQGKQHPVGATVPEVE